MNKIVAIVQNIIWLSCLEMKTSLMASMHAQQYWQSWISGRPIDEAAHWWGLLAARKKKYFYTPWINLTQSG